MSRVGLSVFLSLIGGLTGFQIELCAAQALPSAPASASPTITVSVTAGRSSINVVKPPSATPPVVVVRDSSNRPVIGAIVTFTAPEDMPTVRFPNGKNMYSVVTDESGRAAVEEMEPEGIGRFSIEVAATYDAISGTTTTSEANYPTLKAASTGGTLNTGNQIASPPSHGLSTGAKVGITAGIAVAAGVGAWLAVRGHGHSSTSSTISAGNPTVGAP